MDNIEIIGGIKGESEIKMETLNNDGTDIVEISAEDIQSEVKQESEETMHPGKLKDRSDPVLNVKIKKECQLYNKGNQKETAKDTAISTTKNPQEKLILNYVPEDLYQEKTKYEYKPKKNKKRPIKITLKRNNTHSEYTPVQNNQYSCNHCKYLIASKRKMIKHIKQSHRKMDIYSEDREEKLKRLVEINATTRYVSWEEYSPECEDQFRCSHCQTLIKGQNQMEKHIIDNHRSLKMNQCPYCSYQSQFVLTNHLISCHTDEKDIKYFWCDKCEYKSKLKSGMTRHIRRQHMNACDVPEIFNKCPQCLKVFKKQESLILHIRRVHNNEPGKKIKCFHCQHELKTKTALLNHIQTRHTKVEELETLYCTLCQFKTKFETRMQCHVRTTHNKHLLQCHICSYECNTNTVMDLHLIGHKEEKDDKDLRYRCDRCDYKTYRAYSLQVHKLNHLKPEEIQYFYCYHCNFKAKRKDNLKCHIFRQHKKKEGTFPCYICDFKASKIDELVRHINKHSKSLKAEKKPKTKLIQSNEEPRMKELNVVIVNCKIPMINSNS